MSIMIRLTNEERCGFLLGLAQDYTEGILNVEEYLHSTKYAMEVWSAQELLDGNKPL